MKNHCAKLCEVGPNVFFAVCFLFPLWPWNLMDDLKNNRASLLCYFKLCWSFHNHRWIQTRVIVLKRPIWVKIGCGLVAGDLEIWQMTLTNNRAHFLCYFKSCASFRDPLNSISSYSPGTLNLGQYWLFLPSVTSKFDRWPWKTTGYLFYAIFLFTSVTLTYVIPDIQSWYIIDSYNTCKTDDI